MRKNEKSENETKGKTRILIVDDHPVIREGLTQIINRQPDLMVCAEAGDIREAVKAVRKNKIDLALVDMLLKKTTGDQITKKIKALRPDISVLIFSMSNDLINVKRALRAGARGYITKDELSDKIIAAIRQVLKGKLYLSKNLAQRLSKNEIDRLLAYASQSCSG